MDPLRIWRSPYSDFYKDETLHAAQVYMVDAVRRIGKAGFNAIWIRGILRDLAHLTRILPILRTDKRMGYHSECQHFQFTHGMVQRKIRRLRRVLAD